MIDIVTINKDNKDGLEKTILSVISQTKFDEINYIVIDGGSTDGSVDVIKQYADGIDYWVSEKDKGIFNAMNKGLKQANGEYVLMLNSGDYLASADVIEQVLKYLDGITIIFGDITLFKKNKAMVNYINAEYVTENTYSFKDRKIDNAFFKVASLPHQATFIRTDYHKAHPYNENFRSISDGLFFKEAILKNKVTHKHIPVNVACFELGGISSTELAKKEQDDYFFKY